MPKTACRLPTIALLTLLAGALLPAQGPTAGFTASPKSGFAPHPVSFTDQSTGTGLARSWDFGDGGTSSATNPSHTFSLPGLYTINLTVTNASGTDTLVRRDYIEVLPASTGPDVIVGSLANLSSYGSSGNIAAFSVGTTSCNLGTQNLSWVASTNQHPVIAYSMFRMKSGRFDQVGLSWLKHGFLALTQNLCASCSGQGGSVLGVGCSDPYSSSLNGSQSGLGPRSEINAATGFFPYPPGLNPSIQGTIGRRCQVKHADLDPAQNAGAIYFVEGHYVTPDDAAAGHKNNNASYRRVNVNPSGNSFTISFNGGTQRMRPAIKAWQDFDPSVNIKYADVPGDGRLIVGYRVEDIGGGQLRHVIAVHNLSSDRSVGQVDVDLPPGATASNLGFHDVDYHSGEIWDLTDWPGSIVPSGVSWATTQPFSQNQNANAIRWGTTYTFSFDADQPATQVVLGLFKPGTPSFISVPLTISLGLVANFSATPTSGFSPLSVNFTDLSTGVITNWSWDFGDGTSSTAQNPTHSYQFPGLYTVSLTVSGGAGTAVETKVGLIDVSDPTPVASFAAAGTSGLAPVTTTFTDQSTGNIASWSWSFGDGGTSILQNPVHTYTVPGTYSVSLTVTGPAGSDTATLTNVVTVIDPPPVAAFSATPLSGSAPLLVSFTDQSVGNVIQWFWTFGDGSISTLQNPAHTYTQAGSYTVTLTATGPGGSDAVSLANLITVTPGAPVADFTGTPTTGLAPLVVAFTDASTGGVTSWQWSFGDGGSSTLQNPNYVYLAPGAYTVSLTVTGPGGSDTMVRSQYITAVEPPPVANFTGTPLAGNVPLPVNFTDTSAGNVTAWLWDFGDGTTSTQQSPGHTYTAPGLYTVILTVTSGGGTDTLTRVDYVAVNESPAYLSFDAPTTLPGVGAVGPEDIVLYDPTSQTFSMHFDGSDVGLAGADVNAFHVFPWGGIVMSLADQTFQIPGLIAGPGGNTVSSNDLVVFLPTSVGAATAGSFLFVFEGADVGLVDPDGGIDGVTVVFDNWLVLSTEGTTNTPPFGPIPGSELWLFFPLTLGPVTTGIPVFVWSGPAAGLAAASEDIDALHLDSQARLVFSTSGAFSAGAATGLDEDLGRFAGTFGPAPVGTFDLLLDLSAIGVTTGIDGVTIKQF